MKVYHSIKEFNPKKPTVFTVGMYDGVHSGHRAILKQLQEIAQANNAESSVLTFTPHPRFVLQEDCDLELLTTQNEKIDLLQDVGLDNLIIQPFSFDFSRMTSTEFVRDVLVNQLKIDHFLVGHDHQFGRNREGDFKQLQELADLYGFEVYQVNAIKEQEKPVSSTKIRKALKDGDMAYANQALGYPYRITGTVIKGDGMGRTMGIPTLNLKVDDKKLLPKEGVYGVKVHLEGEEYFGLMNIGRRPTFEKKEKRVEVFVLNYTGDAYGEKVVVEVLTYLREEQKFTSKQELIDQIEKDKQSFEKYIQKNELLLK